jgi:RNA polymerase sigma-70 factor (ECF subfamily)
MTENAPRDRGERLEAANQIDWRATLARHDRWLRTAVFARMRDPDAVDEVMQEVALAAVRQAAPIRDPERVAPWLYRLAVTQCLLYRRKRGRQRKLTDRYVQRQPPAEWDTRTPDPLDWLLAEERRRLVRVAVERLPGRDAELLLLKYTQNWSYHQIAEHLGVSHSAVESRLHRARRKLRNELAAMQLIEIRG